MNGALRTNQASSRATSKLGAWFIILSIFIIACLGGCAANPGMSPSTSPSPTANTQTMSTKLTFHYSDYYSLEAPNPASNCAGDAKRYYDPLWMTPFAADPLNPSTTIRPSFIKNISVDLTDSNSAESSNLAYSCSYTNSPTTPVSSCSTFDYGATNGIPTTLGGTFLIIGGINGIQGYNYNGYLPAGVSGITFKGPTVSCGLTDSSDGCTTSAYTLAVDKLPASAATNPPSSDAPGLKSATGPISTWGNLSGNLSGSTAYTGPSGMAGASASFDSATQNLIIFGGSGTQDLNGNAGGDTTNTWIYSLSSQTWTLENPSTNVDIDLLRTYCCTNPPTLQLSKPVGGRAFFGYTAAQGMALTKMTTDGKVVAANIDTTDRIAIVGGLSPSGALRDSHRFNPTYGPDWIDLQAVGAATPNQWLDSYHTQLLSNATANSPYLPTFPSGANTALNFGMTALRNNAGNYGAGYLLAAGGFDSTITKNTQTASGGVLKLSYKNANTENLAANFAAVPNNIDGTGITPALWSQFTEGGAVPWYGGSTLLPGFNINTNDVVFFGGTDCLNYLTDTTSTCKTNNPGAYWTLTTNPAGTIPGTVPASSAFSGTPPPNAGMAAARGLDSSGNVIIVAWGGMTASAAGGGKLGLDTSEQVYFLAQVSGTTTWQIASFANGNLSGTAPAAVADAAMVFSHVTRKFYIFGGYSPSTTINSADTWELTVNGNCTIASGCTFQWRQLNAGNGLTCFPNCPTGRHGHRMIEANYNNTNPGGSVGGVTSGENDCTSAEAPCSYGIFMEGGGSNNTNLFAERWLFDPTANFNPTSSTSQGYWQLLGELPPRTLSAIASVDYYAYGTATNAHRAILFGGETGLANPALAAGNNYFVPPTLGDTLMYDYDNNTWNRVKLLGKGYNGGPSANLSSFEYRQGYNSASPVPATISELSPPPLSGAIMVTRTLSGASTLSTTQPLKISEVYLFGGRLKTGKFNTLDAVYKFCAGSTGEESPAFDANIKDDAHCDAYDATTNTGSTSPSAAYIGRWLRKAPQANATVNPGAVGSFLGAAVYDPTNDKIVLFGGRTPTATTQAVTDSTNTNPTNNVYEYTFPSQTTVTGSSTNANNGQWTLIQNCSTSAPTARYGHSMGYDALHRQVIIVGGYDGTGTPLTQQITYYDGRTYSTPDVWTGLRTSDSSGNPCYQWSQINTFSNSIDIQNQIPPLYGIAHAASVYIPESGFNTGYYTLNDQACLESGPIVSTDPIIHKLLAGGVDFDLNRSIMGANENVLLNVTLLPLGVTNVNADATPVTIDQSAVFKVHLYHTGLSGDALRLAFQPRFLTYSSTTQYPEVADSIAIIAPPAGQIKQEQIFIPLSTNSTIDRIRIERYSGSGILIDASLYRLGVK